MYREEVRLLLLGMKVKAAGRSVVVMVGRWCGGHQSTVQCPDATLMFLSIGISDILCHPNLFTMTQFFMIILVNVKRKILEVQWRWF